LRNRPPKAIETLRRPAKPAKSTPLTNETPKRLRNRPSQGNRNAATSRKTGKVGAIQQTERRFGSHAQLRQASENAQNAKPNAQRRRNVRVITITSIVPNRAAVLKRQTERIAEIFKKNAKKRCASRKKRGRQEKTNAATIP
jgi:hypothetical protein